MRILSIILTLGLAMFCTGIPEVARADFDGDPGRIRSLTHNTPGSSEHSLFQGSIVIKPRNAPGQEYKWGGTTCPGKNLTVDEVALLERAFLGWGWKIHPFFKNGQGGNSCLVAFTLSR